MGSEFGQYEEWDFESSLDWNLLEYEPHKNTKKYFSALNKLYRSTPALYKKGFSSEGFEWLSYDDTENSVISYIRKGNDAKDDVLIICNFTPNTLENYRVGVNKSGKIKEIFTSDKIEFGGSGVNNLKKITIKKQSWNGKKYSAELI